MFEARIGDWYCSNSTCPASAPVEGRAPVFGRFAGYSANMAMRGKCHNCGLLSCTCSCFVVSCNSLVLYVLLRFSERCHCRDCFCVYCVVVLVFLLLIGGVLFVTAEVVKGIRVPSPRLGWSRSYLIFCINAVVSARVGWGWVVFFVRIVLVRDAANLCSLLAMCSLF